jgi:hypothetical protein
MLALPSFRVFWKVTGGGLLAPFGHHERIAREF